MELLWFVAIGVVAGWLAGRFMRGHGYGLIGDAIVGIIGAFIGGYLFRSVGGEIGGGIAGSLIVAFLGAVLLLFVLRQLKGRRSGRRLWS